MRIGDHQQRHGDACEEGRKNDGDEISGVLQEAPDYGWGGVCAAASFALSAASSSLSAVTSAWVAAA